MSRTRTVALVGVLGALVGAGIAVAVVRHGKTEKVYRLPQCATPKDTIARPSALPASFPLPDGTVFTRLGRSHGVPLIEGRIPLDLDPATKYLERELPRAGYKVGNGEQEPGYEIESDYAVKRTTGRFKVRILFRCRGATRFWISAARF